MAELVFGVSDFVAVFNQTIEYAYPNVTIVGELANFRVSKNRWVYFDLKDEEAIVKFFGTVYSLPGPLEDGLKLQVKGSPRLHPQYGFSITIQSIQPVGEGSIKKAAELLKRKLAAEGLFDDSRKRLLPYPPARIGLVASSESAGYSDFIKVLNHRWGGVEILLADVQVQGEDAPAQIVKAIERFNQLPKPPEVIVVTRGGGSAEDLQAFDNELVVRAVASSRVPTLAAIGHERDISLAELAADQRASTPSNAAELLTPDKKHELSRLAVHSRELGQFLSASVEEKKQHLLVQSRQLASSTRLVFTNAKERLAAKQSLLEALSPEAAMKRGYAILKSGNAYIKSTKQLKVGDEIKALLFDGDAYGTINSVRRRGR